MLGLQNEDGYFKKDKEFEPIGAGLIIVDESSLIDMWLARQFFMRIGNNTKIVLVGDPDQLQSSVGSLKTSSIVSSFLLPTPSVSLYCGV